MKNAYDKKMTLFAVIVSALLLPVCASSQDGQQALPNILFILTDDLGYADVGFMGESDVQTPELDVLAKEGLVLTRHYAMHICSPTRAALMTSRHPMRFGLQASVVGPGVEWGLPLEETLLPQMLKSAGYNTYALGKWHLGHYEEAYKPRSRGFDYFYGLYGGQIDYNTHKNGQTHDWWRNGKPVEEAGYATTLLGEDAVRIIAEEAVDDAPWFMYLSFNAPHSPYQAPPAVLEEAGKEGRKLTHREVFAAMVEEVDYSVGAVVDALRETGQLEDTIVIFSSDNGGTHPDKFSSNNPLRDGKWWIYEGGVRVPAFIRWPGHVPAGQRSEEIISIMDWYPTLANRLGLEMPQRQPVDGVDIWETLIGEVPSPHDNGFVVNVSDLQSSVIDKQWKLLLNHQPHEKLIAHKKLKPHRTYNEIVTEPVELYDLSTDLGERNNVAAQYPEVVERLMAIVREAKSQVGPSIRDQVRARKEAE